MTDDIDIDTWTYRECECRLYTLGDLVRIGYARFGDTWIRVLDTDGLTHSDAISCVESEIDQRIAELVADDGDDGKDPNAQQLEESYWNEPVQIPGTSPTQWQA